MVVKRDGGYHVADDYDSDAAAACAGSRVHDPAAGMGWDGGEDGRGGGGFAEARAATAAPAADHEEGEQDRNTIFFFSFL